MQKLLERQLRLAKYGSDEAFDLGAFIAQVATTYQEFDRDRRLNARAASLMEEELKAANAQAHAYAAQLLNAVICDMAEGVFVTLTSGSIVMANPAAGAMAGADPVALTGTNIAVLFQAADPAQFVSGREGRHFESRLRQGSRAEIEYSVSPMDTGTGAQMLWIVRDVSDRKARERDLVAAREAAESASELKSHFLATMSHELRTPMNAILGFSEVIRDQAFGSELERYSEYASHIHSSGQHLLALINDILDLSKIEAGTYTVELALLDAWDLVEDALRIVGPQAAKGDVALHSAGPGTPAIIHGDARAFRQIVLNILSNGVKFTPRHGSVSVEAASAHGMFKLAIRDTGIGISPSFLAHVFEPFRQQDAGISRKFEGTGLGLAITKRLVEMHNGTVAIESTVGEGTTVTLLLPLASAKNGQTDSATAGAAGAAVA